MILDRIEVIYVTGVLEPLEATARQLGFEESLRLHLAYRVWWWIRVIGYRQEGAYLSAVDRSGELERFQSIRKLIPGGDQECTRVSSGHSQPAVRAEALPSLR
jgi:hypothetical protein